MKSPQRDAKSARLVVTFETADQLEAQARVAIRGGDTELLRDLLDEQHPADIAAVLDRLDHAGRHTVFGLLPPEVAAKVLDEMSIEATRQVLDGLPPAEVGGLLQRLPLDEVTEIITEDVPEQQEKLLALLPLDQANAVRVALKYPPQSAGRMMTERFGRVRPEMTVTEALAHLRQVQPDVETLTDLYVVDPDDRLVGVVSLREVVVADPERKLQDMMNRRLVTVAPVADREVVARLVSHYDYLAIPVVKPDGHILGIVPIDDVLDVLVSEGTEDILRFGGMEGGGAIDQPYFTVPLAVVIRKRVGWLLLLFVAETLTGTVLRFFESELAKVVALSFFIPLLIGTGGNTGAQTVSTLIRGLALGEIKVRDVWRVIWRELGSGLIMGLLLGVVAFGRALLWGSSPSLAAVVGLTILAICAWANTIGSLIPLLAHRLKIDPAVVSAPLITTLVDATGLAIYMLIAKTILGL
jgi:magnesium transporter